MARVWLPVFPGEADEETVVEAIHLTEQREYQCAGAKMIENEEIRRYLLNCRELAYFCSQNGWIDNDSIDYELLAECAGEVGVAVNFEEIIMKGAGCEGRRFPRHGQFRLEVGDDGRIINATPM